MNPIDLNADEQWMAHAIDLAKQGIYTTTPNPRVGCVIVSEDQGIVGQGVHFKAGEPHAEVFALRQAGEKAKGATAYVTLEPCSHYGRTPPCADALIAAGIGRVVIANLDPNPSVDGTGKDRLLANGVVVDAGVLAADAAKLNAGFFKRMVDNKPYVRVKMAASLDGRTALHNGQSQWITGPEARKDVQRFRAMSCAVLTGAGTVLDDDPSLLVRPEQAQFTDYPDMALRQPRRVVVGGKRALPTQAKLFNDGFPTSVFTCNAVNQAALPASADIETVTADPSGFPDLDDVFSRLAQQQCNEIWVEAGSVLAGSVIAQGHADELIVYTAPKLLGDSGLPLLKLPQYETLEQVPHMSLADVTQIGNDLRLTYTF